MASKARLYIFGLVALLVPLQAQGASSYLTDTQFMNRGIGAFVGEITDVQVLSGDETSETGTVTLKIISVISGTISTPTITLPYTRVLQPTDDAANWDNLKPFYVSLSKVGVGRSVLIYFTVDNGTYSLAAASNSVQDASTGLLLGKIIKDDHRQHDNNGEHDKDHGCREVQVQVTEVIYGWVGGSATISLCVDRRSFERNKSGLSDDFSKLGPMADGSALSHDGGDPDELEGQEVFISFRENRISGVAVATSELLSQLQQLDTQ